MKGTKVNDAGKEQGCSFIHEASVLLPRPCLLTTQMSEKQMDFMEERKDALILAAKALESAGGASGSAPAKPPGESSA